MNYTIFDLMYPKYKITKPIRLIEFFAGYGSQALALKYLGIEFEHWKICEWAVKSIQAYKDIHFPNEHYPSDILDISKEEIINYLYEKGISSNYNDPMTLDQIKRLSENDLYTIYENICLTNNLVNIQQVKGKDLEIIETDKYDYILTYSFPCQDLSLAGKRQGMNDTSTRSGMLWEVERILSECEKLGGMPKILLMENVPQVHGEGNVGVFNKWQLRLEELGYKNYFQDLIATDYEIPQTRNRCFMISILGDYSYTFPIKKDLKIKLKDLLENEVDKKYYLSSKQIKDIQNWNAYEKPIENMEKTSKNNISPTITTRSGEYTSSMILVKNDIQNDNYIGTYQYAKSETFMNGKDRFQRGKDKSDTLQTTPKEGVVILGNYSPSNHNASRIVDSNNCSPTVMENHGTVTATFDSNLRIRKLTPKECFRLMGVKDDDFEKVSKNQSDSSLYHLAGDSIVVNVLMAIFKELF